MSFLSAIPVVGDLLNKSLDIVDELVPDRDEAARIKAAVAKNFENNATQIKLAGADIVKAEAAGESWLQRNWRPILMLVVIAIIFNNYVLIPYLSLFTDKIAMLELPGGLWALLNLGVGGYVAGRTGEKIARTLKGS